MADSNKKKTKKTSASTKGRRRLAITLTIILFVAAAGIIGYLLSERRSAPSASVPENFVSYPTVSSSVSSSRDNASHTVDVDFVVEYNGDVHKTVSHDAVYVEMMNTLGKIDYEELKSVDSVERVETYVKDSIAAVAGDDAVLNVYVSNLVIDFPNAMRNVGTESGAQQRLRGLFKNIN